MSVISGSAEMDGNRLCVGNDMITGDFNIIKTNEKDTPLANVEFIIGYFSEYQQSVDEASILDTYNIFSTPDGTYEYSYGIFDYDSTTDTYVFNMYDFSDTREGATVLKTDSDGNINISGLPQTDMYKVGYFLIETNAPAGYLVLDAPIVFTVNTDGSIHLSLSNSQVSVEDTTISIVDKSVVTMPSTGSTGIFLWIIAGIVVVAGGLFGVYKYRRRTLH